MAERLQVLYGGPVNREEQIDRIRKRKFDLLVIGGGINGCAIARDAALRGLKVALVEKDDFASGTSSRTSKMIHGGFRYMEQGRFGLVHESVTERDRLRRTLAPRMVRPLPFLFPIYRNFKARPWQMRIGMNIYDTLAAFRNIQRHRMLSPAETLRHVPQLRPEGLQAGGYFHDCSMDDARLTLTVLRSAVDFGACAANYLKASRVVTRNGSVSGAVVRDVLGRSEIMIEARVVVNAAGPWVDEVREDAGTPGHLLRKTKGVHIVFPRERLPLPCAIGIVHPRDRRLMFAFPWEHVSIVGTTDTDFTELPDGVAATREEADYLIEAVHHVLPGVELELRDASTSYAGVRPLVSGDDPEARPSQVSREEVIRVNDRGLVTVAGGKFTTHRKIAEKVMNMICRSPKAPDHRWAALSSRTRNLPLFESTELLSGPTTPLLDHLMHRYGTRAVEPVRMIFERPELGAPILEGLPYVWAEIDYAAEREMAESLSDVLFRRVPLALMDPAGAKKVAPAVAGHMGALRGWSEDRGRKAVRTFQQELAANRAFLRGAGKDSHRGDAERAE